MAPISSRSTCSAVCPLSTAERGAQPAHAVEHQFAVARTHAYQQFLDFRQGLECGIGELVEHGRTDQFDFRVRGGCRQHQVEPGKQQAADIAIAVAEFADRFLQQRFVAVEPARQCIGICLLYTSDAADERSSVDLGGRRIIKKKNYARVQ